MPHTHPAPADPHPSSDQVLLSTLSSSAHTFLQPPPSLHAASLVIAKRYLDPLAQSTSEAQAQRQQDARRKRKRGQSDGYDSERMLRMKQIHTEGFGVAQVWEQAKRVLDASREEIEQSFPDIVLDNVRLKKSENLPDGVKVLEQPVKRVAFDEDGFELGSSSSELEENGNLDALEDEAMEEGASLTDDEIALEEDVQEAEAAEDVEDDIGLYENDMDGKPSEVFVPDKNGLNDGFFSIDDFNRQSEFLEQRDARGDPDDGAASDEEDIDWDANPVALSVPTKGFQDKEAEQADAAEGEEDGPTFKDADLNDEDLSEEDLDIEADMDDMGPNNTNDIMYADFFAPPPRKASKKNRALPKTQPPPSLGREPDAEDDVQRTISAVRRDIFEDALSPNESNHEKRQAKLAAEIRKLEAASVAKRDWTLSGEARAADRPLNSLLEEDLDFERAGKPIPVITSEVSEDIEALIKRRILAREFDEVVRRRPGDLVTGKNVRRGRFELDDSKPQQSLAEIYEAEHLENADPEGYMSKRDEKLKKEHETIEKLWADVSAKLDALSSWHYKPKPPEANINVVADVPTISMEDARPSAGGDVTESMLAPQEVYKAGEGADKKREVVPKSGLVKAREEMTREEKLRRRRREKERIRKAGGLNDSSKAPKSEKAKEKKEVVGQLKRGGVRVIGKKGELRDVEGKAADSRTSAGKGAGNYKL
ncbi:U3 small nucleolar ribonucleoprotein mpp10 [Physcia stellaris]|nr:U3 small nucleolar ribonucleoprotein mpp10 [Physcia stellaris]